MFYTFRVRQIDSQQTSFVKLVNCSSGYLNTIVCWSIFVEENFKIEVSEVLHDWPLKVDDQPNQPTTKKKRTEWKSIFYWKRHSEQQEAQWSRHFSWTQNPNRAFYTFAKEIANSGKKTQSSLKQNQIPDCSRKWQLPEALTQSGMKNTNEVFQILLQDL